MVLMMAIHFTSVSPANIRVCDATCDGPRYIEYEVTGVDEVSHGLAHVHSTHHSWSLIPSPTRMMLFDSVLKQMLRSSFQFGPRWARICMANS